MHSMERVKTILKENKVRRFPQPDFKICYKTQVAGS